jgi:hypothetical protein
MSKIVLDDWQEEVMAASGNILLCTGRQIGKTFIMARKCAFRLLEKKTDIVVISLTEDQAKLMISMVLTTLEEKDKKAIRMGKDKPTQNKIELKNGSKIIARPVGLTGDSVRGFTGDILVIDEASRMSTAVMDACKPILLSTGGDIWICSTPFGKKGFFYESFLNTERFKVFHKSSVEVIQNRPLSEFWTQEKRDRGIKFLEDEKKSMSKTRFGQEYEGLFMEDLQQFFSDELILRAMGNHKRPGLIDKYANNFCGIDIARMGEDLTVWAIGKVVGDRIIQVESEMTAKTLLSATTKHTLALHQLYDFKRIFIDDEGIGVGVYDYLLDDENTRRVVVPINNSKRMLDHLETQKTRLMKTDLYNNLLMLMEFNRIDLLDDQDIFNSLKSVQYEYTTDTKGTPTMKIFGNWTHHAEALVRLAWAVKYKELNIWVKSI